MSTYPPHLLTPLNLARLDMGGKFRAPRHLLHLNRLLTDVGLAPDGVRLMLNVMQQVAKTTTVEYFLAWSILRWPARQIIYISGTEDLARKSGLNVRDVIDRHGGPLGVRLRADTKAKGNWMIEGHGGGVYCVGRGGSPGGRAADVVVIDDMLRDASEAYSEALMDANWALITSVVLGRLRRQTALLMIGTRWSRKDHFGRMAEAARLAGDWERWQVVKYTAIALENDVLGRKPGEHLWPEQVNPKDVEFARKTSAHFEAAWQQSPPDETGAHFKPDGWPRYSDLGPQYGQRSWAVPVHGGRSVVFPRDATVLVTVDWAASERRRADLTAFGAWALLADGRLLCLEVRAGKYPLEAVVSELAKFCRIWRPDCVGTESDSFQGALANECRRYREIGEVRRFGSESKTKLQRAVGAIIMGNEGRVLLPDWNPDWLPLFTTQLSHFSGDSGDQDDMVDCFSYACRFCRELTHSGPAVDNGPVVLSEGHCPFWG